jgi:hypothetical protein
LIYFHFSEKYPEQGINFTIKHLNFTSQLVREMIIQTSSAKFLIEPCENRKDCVLVNSNSKEELDRLFGSFDVSETNSQEYPFQVKSCKQEFANALIIMVKEIDYSHFWSLDLQFI